MIYQNYKLDKAELCLHTVSTNGGGGQIWQVFLVPWNRPSFRAARVKPNLLPGCQWRIFDTTRYSGVGIGSGEGSTNEIGVGGALYVTQNDPKFYVDIYGANAAATLTGQLPMSMAMPTFSVHGRDTTEWMCFLWRLRMIKGDPSQDTYFLYTVKLYFTFTGIRLSQAGGLTQLALGCDYPRQPDAFPTYDDPTEQERRDPILRHLVRGENPARAEPLAWPSASKEKPKEVLVRGGKRQSLDQTDHKGCEGQDPKRFRSPVRPVCAQRETTAG